MAESRSGFSWPMSSVVHSINVSPGGVPKLPVSEARITTLGLEGDNQRNRLYHGGPMRAVSLYSLERIEALNHEGHSIGPGTTGENITVQGMDWSAVMPGMILRVGEAELEITSYVRPCKTIRSSFAGEEIWRISQVHHPGWSRVYARVQRDGLVRLGDPVEAAVSLKRE